MPVMGEDSFEAAVEKIKREQGVSDEHARRIVGSIEHKQKKARLLKLRLAATGIKSFDAPTQQDRRNEIQNYKKTNDFSTIPKKGTRAQRRVKQEVEYINKGEKIRPTTADQTIDRDVRKKLAKEHGHSIVFKGVNKGTFRAASLENQNGKYAKYWLLNAKQTNGNGWGIAAHTAKENMSKFIGRPLVVTSAKWHGASVYGNNYEHPYLPTNDLNQIFAHQEQYRVGSIIDVNESNGDWYATIEMLPKFAHMSLPPFCSPAIYQLDASEHEGQISKWEALHLAALDENPAYGARIALLKGTCVGTPDACKIQFKSAKQRTATIFDEDVENKPPNPINETAKKKQLEKVRRELGVTKPLRFKEAEIVCPKKLASIHAKLDNLKKNQKIALNRREIQEQERDSAFPLDKREFAYYDEPELPAVRVESFTKFPERDKRTKNISRPINRKRGTNFNLEGTLESPLGDILEERAINRRLLKDRGQEETFGELFIRKFGPKGLRNENPDSIQNQIGTISLENARRMAKIKQKIALNKKINAANTIASFGGVDATRLTKERTYNKNQVQEPPNIKEDKVSSPAYFVDAAKDDRLIKIKNKPRKGTSLAKLKARLASLGEQNMTYQSSKKVKIHKKKYPEVRKAQDDIEDILRGKGSSVDASHHQSTFLSTKGDFIGGGEPHYQQIQTPENKKHMYFPEDGDEALAEFQRKTGLVRVQSFPINRAGEERTSVGIHSKINRDQLKSIQDLEKGGRIIGFAVGPDPKTMKTGTGFMDMVKALREHKFL